MSTLVGMQLNGRYRLDAQVGHGGMSTVYRAFDATLERQVAIKLMHRDIARVPDQLERFRREARAVAQLSHPHVVGVIDAGEDDGRPYIVFEYVEGETLKQRIRRTGRLQVEEAVAYAIEIARALEAAHARGIIHRDIKPQNVLIDEEGSAKVTDFGIARSLDEEGLTADGRVLGTTDYVSPEQALGHPVTGQSDIYSLGIVLYEMLTGDVPFHGENQVSVAMKHVREDLPDIAAVRPQVSTSLAAVLDRMTAKDLGRRHADARELIADLEDVLSIEASRSGQATGEATAVLQTIPGRKRRRLPLRLRFHASLAAILLVIAALVAVVVLALTEGPKQVKRGTGAGPIEAPRGSEVVSVQARAAKDYDPVGGDGEHPSEASAAVDRDVSTAWSTETYEGGTLNNKPGVGIYLDARPRVAATQMEVRSKTTGYEAEVYVATDGPPDSIDGWQRVASGTVDRSRQRFDLDTAGRPFRYYLLWITSLPEDGDKVEIAELALLKRQG